MKPKTLGIVVGVIAVVLIGFLFFRLPQPVIDLRPEKLFSIGPFDVTNTIFTAWVMIALISLVCILGTRKLTLVPSGFQNFFEAIVEGFGNIANNVAGERNGRRFFPVVFVLFFYIVLCNWTALTPIFNVLGATENIREQAIHEAREEGSDQKTVSTGGEKVSGWVLKKSGFHYVPLFKETDFVEFTIPQGTTFAERPCVLDYELAKAELARDQAERFHYERGQPCPLPTAGSAEEETGPLPHGQVFGVIKPFLRGVNTDVNAPLSYAIWSAIFVEFWGITALGVLGYGSKFFNFRGGPIGVFVGFLELVSEIARLISFTFRLFGNIFAGEVLLFMMSFLVPFVLVDVFYGLELFVGLVQAFVFAMLTLVFGVMAVSGHGDHEEHGEAPSVQGAVHEQSHA